MKLNLKTKAVGGNLSILFLALAVLCIFISTYTMNICRSLVSDNLVQLSHRYANEIDIELEKAYETTRGLATAIEAARLSGIRDRSKINKMLERTLAANPGIMGIGTAWEPEAFDGRDADFAGSDDYGETGRFTQWYFVDGGKMKSMPWGAGVDQKSYYKQPKESGLPSLSSPYWEDSLGEKVLLTTISVPITVDGNFLGVVEVDIFITSLIEMMEKVRPYGVGAAAIFMDDGTIVSHLDPDRIGKDFRKTEAEVVGEKLGEMSEAVLSGSELLFTVGSGRQAALAYLSPFTIGEIPTTMTFASTAPLSVALKEVNGLVLIVIAGFAATLLLIGLFTFFLMSRITKPVITISSFLESNLTEGDLSETLDRKLTSKTDEIGTAASSTNRLIEKLQEVISDIQSAAMQVVGGSRQISDSSQRISTGASEQASSIEELTSSMEELSSTIAQNSANSDVANNKASAVTADAVKSGEAAAAASTQIREIADKISIIGEFSRNTNLLALNAAIEAARAGEDGKGFAVVAQEIRKLAVNSQAAASEIIEIAGTGVKSVENVKSIIESMIPELKETAQLVQEITAASAEQSQGAEQMNSALQQMNAIVQENAGVSEELASMAEEMNAQAEGMNSSVGFFTLETRRSPESDAEEDNRRQKALPVST